MLPWEPFILSVYDLANAQVLSAIEAFHRGYAPIPLAFNRHRLAFLGIPMPTYAKALTIDQYQALLHTIPTHCASTVITLGGKRYTSTQLVALIKSVLDAELGVSIAKAVWQEAIKKAAEAEATDGRTIKDARASLARIFAHDNGTLALLGIDPPKERARLTAEERLLATAKLRATRIARGTKSKKQLSRIKGNVTGVTIEAVVAGSTDETEG